MSETPWQDQTSTIKERLSCLFKNKFASDIIFEVKGETDDRTYRFRAHKLVMAMTSNVFYSMCYEQMDQCEIKITDISSTIFKRLLRYAYLEEITIENRELALMIAVASKKYGMISLVEASTQFMISDLTVKNACSSYEMGIALKSGKLIQQSMEIILANIQVILESDDIFQLSENTLISLISNSFISSQIKVTVIFQSVYRYAKNVLAKKGENQNSIEKIRDASKKFLPRIEFLRLNFLSFVSGVCKTGIFTKDEVSVIGDYLSNDDKEKLSRKLPDWCNLCFRDNSILKCEYLVTKPIQDEFKLNSNWLCKFSTSGPRTFIRGFHIMIHLIRKTSINQIFNATISVNGFVKETSLVKKDLGALMPGNKCLVWFPLDSLMLPKGKNEVLIEILAENPQQLVGVLGLIRGFYKCGSYSLSTKENTPKCLEFEIELRVSNENGVIESILFFLERKSYIQNL